MAKKAAPEKSVETIVHEAEKRKNLPMVEFQSSVNEASKAAKSDPVKPENQKQSLTPERTKTKNKV